MKKVIVLLMLAACLFSCDDDFVADITVDSSELPFLNDGGKGSLDISSNISWHVSVDQPWVKLSKNNGNLNDVLDITVEPNNEGIARTAIISLYNNFAAEASRTIIIKQDKWMLDTKQLDFTYQTSTQGLPVNIYGEWTAESNNEWIIITKKEYKGFGTVDVTVKPNDSGAARSGSVIIKGTGVNDREIKVQQAKLPEFVGLYILAEGYMGTGKASISYYDVKTNKFNTDYFKEKNNFNLGDTGNDLAIYGSKMYCIVSGPNNTSGGQVYIIDPQTGMSKKRIEFKDAAGKPAMPRQIEFYKDKAYITSYSGLVARLDTLSLNIDAYATLSGTDLFPEGITQYNGNLYVCNSGQGKGNSISVIDIASFKESRKITVPTNPANIAATFDGDIYFNTADNTGTGKTPSRLHILDPKTETVTKTFDNLAGRIAIGKDYLYTVETNYQTYENVSIKVNLATKEASVFTTELKMFFMPYGVSTNYFTGDVYIGGQGEDVCFFNSEGKLQSEWKTGKFPCVNTIVPVYR